MYRKNIMIKTSAMINNSTEGETIEQKMDRVVNNKEPITDGAPIIFTERKDGVLPGYDIRTDRFEVAIEAMDKVTKSQMAKREKALGDLHEREKKDSKTEGKDSGAESIQGDINTTE